MKTQEVPDSFAEQFCTRLLRERDWLLKAQHSDKVAPRPQRGPWGRSRVGRLVERLQPRYGPGIAKQLYQAALAEAAQGTMPTIFAPLLTAAWDAHNAMVNSDSPADYWEQHCRAVQPLIDHLSTVRPAPLKRHRDVARARRASKPQKSRPLTPRQIEVVQIVGECKGNIAEAARRLGRTYKTVEESYRAGLAKLGKTAVRSRDKTRLLARDRRGQIDVSEDDDCRC